MVSKKKLKILVVCTGNICRSPTAEGVLRHYLAEANMSEFVEVESAGTDAERRRGWPPEPMAIEVAIGKGYDISGMQARQVDVDDFRKYHYILAMDHHNYDFLRFVRPPDSVAKLRMYMSFTGKKKSLEVPDPFGGGRWEFKRALRVIDEGAKAIVRQISSDLGHTVEAV